MRFKRQKAVGTTDGDDQVAEVLGAPVPAASEALEPATGPRDVSEVDDLGAIQNVVDLGSLLIPLQDGMDLRLQVDETSGEVLAALVVGEDGMLELRAFAAQRNGDLWAEARREIAADTSQRGGTATERDGALGPELYCEVQVQMDDGTPGVQPSRIVGWNGPRWFLRGALLGAPAMQPEKAGPWEEFFNRVIVRRGEGALPPGDALPLTLPPEAQRVEVSE